MRTQRGTPQRPLRAEDSAASVQDPAYGPRPLGSPWTRARAPAYGTGEASALPVRPGERRPSESEMDRSELVAALEAEMLEAAEALEFERAAKLRDRIKELKDSPEMVVGERQPGNEAARQQGAKVRGRRVS